MRRRTMRCERWKKALLIAGMLIGGSMFPAVVTHAATGNQTVAVDAKDGSVQYTDSYNGPRIKKIRLLEEGNFLEIYWDRYVDETQAVNTSNFVLKNGNTTIQLEEKGTDYTNTLYFDQKNKEIAATEANSMARLDSGIHMSSICLEDEVDLSKDVTLEVKGSAIKDENGKSAENAVYTNIPEVSYYTQSVETKTGIIVKADDTVAHSSLEKAAEQIDIELGKTENGIAANMKAYNCSLAVYSPHENVYMIPEHRYWFNKDMYDVEGYGGNTYNNCVSSIAEQNIIRTLDNTDDWYQNTMYRNENILIHEFGHCVKSVGMDLLEDQTLHNEYIAAYEHAKKQGLWPNSYAISNEDEFFATMCAIWFNSMEEVENWDGVRGPVNTREELRQYDPQTYEVFAKILPDQTLPSPWDKDVPDDYHDANYKQEVVLPFTDVAKGAWYYEAVAYNYENQLMTGVDSTHFAPDEKLARAQFAVILYRMNGSPAAEGIAKFKDVPAGTWFTDAVIWANGIGVINGYSDTGLFGPGDQINREQMAVMMYRYAVNYKKIAEGTKASLDSYADGASVSAFAKEAVEWAVGNGIITGKNNGTVLDPQGNATRSECAMIMMRFIDKFGK